MDDEACVSQVHDRDEVSPSHLRPASDRSHSRSGEHDLERAGFTRACEHVQASRPAVGSRTIATASLLGVHDDVGPEELRGLEPAIGQINRDDVTRAAERRAPMIADKPIGPAPMIATTSPGAT